jgi:AcrR family transcriptional regulator
MTSVAGPIPRRERARAATVDEIKATALELMHEQGTTDVRFTDIARVMGMTPPALYRYFADRDELLIALITDAYNDLGDAVAAARDAVDEEDIRGRWIAAAGAYRQWALREPQQFSLIFGLPVPGFVAPQEGPTTEAASRALSQLAAMFADASRRGRLDPPLVRTVPDSLRDCVAEEQKFSDIAPESFQAMLHAWASLHGITSLEAYGHLDWMDPEARDALFLGQVRLAAQTAGLPADRDAAATEVDPASVPGT